MKHLLLIAACLLALVACASDAPQPNTPQPYYPCGEDRVCTDAAGTPTGLCCSPDRFCGSETGVRCHAGDCCLLDGAGRVGAGAPTPQFRRISP